MRFLQRALLTGWMGWLVLMSGAAQAHLMVAQRGTLNFVDAGAFMVLSLPVSAFQGIDDDGDGRLSMAEGHAHWRDIEEQVRAGVQLVSEQGAAPLQGVFFNLSPPDDAPAAPASQLVVMGRFAWSSGLQGGRFGVRLFGTQAGETSLQITVTRGGDTQLLTLSPERAEMAVFPGFWAVISDQVMMGAHHVWAGADHLLFLLVVLAAGVGLSHLVWTLTCFTLGHALTLLACVLWGWKVSPALVEPAIAITIVGMAGFDRWSQKQGQTVPAAWRWGLVFFCALIHGLGMAEALTGLGLQGARKFWSLLGFNLGIELGQLAAAGVAMGVFWALRRFAGASAVAMALRLASWSAMGLGTFWFFQRVALTAL
ncbi:HupE/UreJ family protein [Limnohabitans planktonicus]|nr:HupE/UreJ family protein [Limnohabitans planktonicus]